MTSNGGYMRYTALRYVVFITFAALLGRVFYLQIIDDRYADLATSNMLEIEVEYPMRGEVLDRRGEYLVKSRVCYDVMVISKNLPKEGFDTMRLAAILEMPIDKIRTQLKRAAQAPRAPDSASRKRARRQRRPDCRVR